MITGEEHWNRHMH